MRAIARTAGVVLLAAVATAQANIGPLVGAVPPELDADRWYNVDGEDPTLAALRGRAVLIEFWATW